MTKEGGMYGASQQEKLLEEALKAVQSEAFAMKRCLDQAQLMEGLKHASQLLSELRTSDLSPKYYYRLYIDVTNEMQHLEMFLVDEFQKGRKVSDLYELVQYAGNIIPRMYLLITVGMVYMKTGEWRRKDILKDLVEMCRGVQHPLRGLFLRNYLVQCTRNLLPDTPEDPEGNVRDSIDFILLNFSEMNKLWVRMQHQGPTREQEKREKERRELRILVGTNLVRLSQLENLTPQLYAKVVLPGMLEQVVSCKDPLAQEYLMECIIQVFPDELHLLNLQPFLTACGDLHQGVQVKNILIALIDRLATFASTEQGRTSTKDLQLFQMFNEQVGGILSTRTEMAGEDAVALELALLSLALKCYPANLDYADSVFQSTAGFLQQFAKDGITYNSQVGKETAKLLHLPVDYYNDVLQILKLSHYSSVLETLDGRGRRSACSHLLTNILANNTLIDSQEEVESLLGLVSSLVRDDEGSSVEDQDPEDFAEEQNLVARVLPLLHSDNPDTHYLILSTARKLFGEGGAKRMAFTLPPVIFSVYQLAQRFKAREAEDEKWEAKVGKVFKFCHSSISALQKETEQAELALRLFLHGALLIDNLPHNNSESLAYEFMTQAFSLYEEEMSESRAQVAALSLLMGTLERIRCFGEENHEPLRTQCALAAAKLFKKPDQCRAVAAVANVFWSGHVHGADGPMRDGQRVYECLKKALKIASQCMDPAAQTQLFVTVLNDNIYFYHQGCQEVTLAYVNQLLSKIRETLPQLEPGAETAQIGKSFQNTLDLLRARLQDPDSPVSYQGLVL